MKEAGQPDRQAEQQEQDDEGEREVDSRHSRQRLVDQDRANAPDAENEPADAEK